MGLVGAPGGVYIASWVLLDLSITTGAAEPHSSRGVFEAHKMLILSIRRL
jgi:hypothetical protein